MELKQCLVPFLQAHDIWIDSKEIWQNDLTTVNTTIGWINGAHKKIILCQPVATQICNGINKLYNDANDNRKQDPEQREQLHTIYTLHPDNHHIIVNANPSLFAQN